MIRGAFRVLLALALAAVVWWIGPLIAIGVYHPFDWLVLRQVLVVLLLLWGFWPVLGRVWVWLAMGTRQLKPAPRVDGFDAITGRLRDLDRQLRTRWQRQPRRRWARWRGAWLREHRSFLPWLLLLGASGSGKTSLVTAAATRVGSVERRAETPWRDSARTGDVEAWLTDDAVWFDTSGRWTVRDGLDVPGFAAWNQFLRGVRRMRSGPVLNGVVMCVDANELLHAALENRKRLAEALRGRLAELCESLDQPMQAYIALTGLDKLDGGIAVLSMMSSAQWSRGLGFSLVDTGSGDDGGATEAVWREAMLEMENRVQQQVQFAAPATGDVSVNLLQLRFVETLARLRGPLLALMAGVIGPGEGDSPARLRGVWFGSVAQVVDGELSGAVQGPADEDATRSLAQLWHPLYRQVVMEQGLRWGQHQRPWRARLASGARWAALAGLTCLGLGWLGGGYLSERNNLERVWAQFNEGKRLAQQQAGETAAGSALLEVASQMRYARDQAEETAQLMPTSYIEHSRVATVANATYHRHLERTLMPELHNAVQEALMAQAQGSPGDLYLTLKIYLMLSRPERRAADDLARWISGRWDALAAGGQYGEEDRHVLIAHARALFSTPGLPGTPENTELVRSARARAAQIPSVTRVLQLIRDQGLPPSVNDVSLASAAGYGASLTLKMRSNLAATDSVVPGWYTRAGYLDNFLPRLRKSARATLEEESWVLRDESLAGNSFEIERTVEKLADATRSQFLQDYVQRWKSFLNDVTVRNFTGLDDASQLAAALIDPQSSLALLLRFAGRETSLTGNYDGDVDSWIDRQKHNLEQGRRAVVGEIAGEHYRNKLLPEHVVEDYFSPVRRLATQLTQSSGTSNPLARLFEPVSRQLGLVNGAMQAGQVLPQYDAFARLRGEAGRQPEPVRGVMLDLINNGSSMTARQSSGMLTRGAAGGATRAVCEQGVAGRYPLLRGARAEAGIQDYERLFGPQGLMATQFKEQLAPYVDSSSSPWRARRPEGGTGALISDEIVRAYEVAERIRGATIDESGHLKVSTVLRFMEMDPQLAEAELIVGDQSIRFAHGVTAPRQIDWRTQNSKLDIRLQLRAIDGRTETLPFDGPWAIFRFFDAGRQPGGTDERRETLHRGSLGSVRMEWKAPTIPSPLWSDLLSSFRCPR